MRLSKKHAGFVAAAILGEITWVFAAYEAIALLANPFFAYPQDQFASLIPGLAVFGSARLILTTWGLLTMRPGLWWLPVAAASFEIYIFASSVPIVFEFFGSFADVLPILLSHLAEPGIRHFWLFAGAPAFILPALALRSHFLLASRLRRAV